MERPCRSKTGIRENPENGPRSSRNGDGGLHHARHVIPRSGQTAQGSVRFRPLFAVSVFLNDLRSGLTAYNHNLDTSREFYPKVQTFLTFKYVTECDTRFRLSLHDRTTND